MIGKKLYLGMLATGMCLQAMQPPSPSLQELSLRSISRSNHQEMIETISRIKRAGSFSRTGLLEIAQQTLLNNTILTLKEKKDILYRLLLLINPNEAEAPIISLLHDAVTIALINYNDEEQAFIMRNPKGILFLNLFPRAPQPLTLRGIAIRENNIAGLRFLFENNIAPLLFQNDLYPREISNVDLMVIANERRDPEIIKFIEHQFDLMRTASPIYQYSLLQTASLGIPNSLLVKNEQRGRNKKKDITVAQNSKRRTKRTH